MCGDRETAQGRTIVRARNSERKTDIATSTTMAAPIIARCLWTRWVNALSLVVASSTPPLTGTAAEMTGVRSGALRTFVFGFPVSLALIASGQACRRSTRGSTNFSNAVGADEEVETAVESSCYSFVHLSSLGILSWYVGPVTCQLSATSFPFESEHPQPAAGRFRDGRQDRAPAVCSCRLDCQRSRCGLDPCLPRPFLAQSVAEDVKIKRAQGDQQHRDEVQRQNPVGKGPPARPFQPKIGLITIRRIRYPTP